MTFIDTAHRYQTTDYGEYAIAAGGWKTNRDSRQLTYRVDRWVSKHSGARSLHITHCLDGRDTSDVYVGKYEPECGWCWLGATHTQDAHDR